MKCSACHKELPDGMKFCGHCGQPRPGQPADPRESSAAPDQSLGDEATIRETPRETLPPRSLGDLETQTGEGGGGERRKSGSGTPLSDRYELLEEIGRGGFAFVWKARDRKLGRTVAVKRLLPERLEGKLGQQTLKRFEKEASSIARLNHRNIVTVYDHDRDYEGHYIVMEYVDGGTLKEYLKSQGGRLETGEAVALVRGIAQGLGYAHRNNLIHRDIKPANVLLQRDGEELVPKIVDFGLARVGTESELSMSGFGMGTPWYMPPEQRRNAKGVNHTADIYALGKTLYELVSGEVPDNVDPEKISDPGLLRVILKCVKSKPGERYFSCEEVIKDLEGDTTAPSAQAHGRKGEGVCPSCGELNPDGAKYCGKCGTGMVRPCPECGTENSIYRKYCVSCGTDVEGFLKAEEALGKMKGYLESRKIGRVLKEAELLGENPFEAKGEKGKALLGEISRVWSEASAKQSEKKRHASAARRSYEKGFYEKVIKEIEAYENIAGELPEELRELREKSLLAEVAALKEKLERELNEGNFIKCYELLRAYRSDFGELPEEIREMEEKIAFAEIAALKEDLDRKFRARDFIAINKILQVYRSRTGKLPRELRELRETWLLELRKKFDEACAQVLPHRAEEVIEAARSLFGSDFRAEEGKWLAGLGECRRKLRRRMVKRGLRVLAGLASIAAIFLLVRGGITVIGNIRFNSAMSEAHRAIEREEWEEAVQSADRAVSMRESNLEALALLRQARAGAHQAKLEGLLKSARKSIERRDWEEAIKAAKQAIAHQPRDREATALLNQAKDGPRQESIERFLKSSREAIEREDWEGAIEAAEQVINLQAGHRKAMALLNQAKEGARQEKIDRILQSSRQAIARRDWEEAIKTAEQVLTLQPGHREAAARLNQAKEQVRQESIERFLKSSREAIEREDWGGAIKAAEQTIALQSGHQEATVLLKQAKNRARQESIERFLKSSREAMEREDWEGAIKTSEQALGLQPGHREATAIANRANFCRFLNQAKEFESAKRWPEAYKVASRALALKPRSQEASDLIGRIRRHLEPKPNQLWKSPTTGMEFVWIDALNIWVGKYEVTNEEYRKMVPNHNSGLYEGYSLNKSRQPVVYVSFIDAKGYAEWMTRQERSFLPKGYRYRLPSNEEFMVYCQCGDDRDYPWGSWPPRSGRAGNYHGQEGAGRLAKISRYNDGHPVTCDVEKSWANPWVLYGVGGNVWEVCASDVSGESFGGWRGASWRSGIQADLRCSSRFGTDGTNRRNNVGFRLVLSR